MDRFESMRTFTRVVETGSISGAAEGMGIAKSAVSRRLAELEEHLGVQLMQRTTRRLNLTETGQSFYDRSVRVLADLEEAEQAVSCEHATPRGKLRVAVPMTFGLLHLTPAITDFMQQHPDVEFDLDFNDWHVDLVREGFDVAIRISKLSDSSLIARQLAPIHNIVCASPEYIKQHGAPQTPTELKQHICLAYSNIRQPGVWRYLDKNGDKKSINVPIRIHANNGDFLRMAAIAGHGIVLEPTFVLYQAIQHGELVPILTDYDWPGINAYAIYPQTRHLSKRVRVFVDFLVERFAGVPYWDQAIIS